jgi:hypothetical protein
MPIGGVAGHDSKRATASSRSLLVWHPGMLAILGTLWCRMLIIALNVLCFEFIDRQDEFQPPVAIEA